MSHETPIEGYIFTGVEELDKRLGMGIPVGSLGLIEGGSDVGKSVFCQHMAYSTLRATENSVAYYTTEHNATSLIAQMESLSLHALDYFLLDRLRIYQLGLRPDYQDTTKPFWALTNHLSKLPERYKLVIIDSITDIVTHSKPASTLDFFYVCKKLCEDNRCVFVTAHSLTFDRETFNRASELCDAYLRLSFVDHEIYGPVNVLEMLKTQWATHYIIGKVIFEIRPKMGIRSIPLAETRV